MSSVTILLEEESFYPKEGGGFLGAGVLTINYHLMDESIHSYDSINDVVYQVQEYPLNIKLWPFGHKLS